MALASIVTRGYANGTQTTTIASVVLRGYLPVSLGDSVALEGRWEDTKALAGTWVSDVALEGRWPASVDDIIGEV